MARHTKSEFPSSAIDQWPWPPDLRTRRLTPEWMDDPRLHSAEHQKALRGLGRLNRLDGAANILWPFVMRELSTCRRRPLRVLDVACGSGDVLRELHRRAAGKMEAIGIDISAEAVAGALGAKVPGLRFEVMDALGEDVQLPRADVVLCSLFLHHLESDQVVLLLERMARAAGRRIVVSDLERTRASWLTVWFAARLVTRSRVVHHDSARSVEAGWRASEIESLAKKAGLSHVRVVRSMPCRLVMTARPTQRGTETQHE